MPADRDRWMLLDSLPTQNPLSTLKYPSIHIRNCSYSASNAPFAENAGQFSALGCQFMHGRQAAREPYPETAPAIEFAV